MFGLASRSPTRADSFLSRQALSLSMTDGVASAALPRLLSPWNEGNIFLSYSSALRKGILEVRSYPFHHFIKASTSSFSEGLSNQSTIDL